MPTESSLSQLSRLTAVILTIYLLFTLKNHNSYQTLLFSLLLSSVILLFCPHGLFPSELFSSIAGLPLLALPFSTLFQTPNKPPKEGHRPLRPQGREGSFTRSGADDL